MKCALASMGFINGDLRHNKQVILDTMTAYSGKADVVIFGEAFLQGFYAAAFDAAHEARRGILAGIYRLQLQRMEQHNKA